MSIQRDGATVVERIHSQKNNNRKTSGRCSGCRASRRMEGDAFGNTLVVSWVASALRAGYENQHRLEYGHISTFTFTQGAGFQKVSDFWYHYCTVGMGEVAASSDGMVIGVLCGADNGTAIPKDQVYNWQEGDPNYNPRAGWPGEDWRRRGIYLLEWNTGSVTQTPDAIVLLNANGGGVNYGHWSLVLNNDASEYTVRNKVATWVAGHETVVPIRVRRTAGYAVEFSLSASGCNGGHQYSNRLTHNTHSNTVSEYCQTDRAFLDWFVYNDAYNRNVSSAQNLITYSPFGSAFVPAGGPGLLASKGQNGWMASAVGPPDVFSTLPSGSNDNARRALLDSGKQQIGLINLPLAPENFDATQHQWKWITPTMPDGSTAGRAGKVQLRNWGTGGDGSGRYLLGYSPSMDRYGNSNYHTVVELDNDMNIVNGPYHLTMGAWVQDSPGIYMPGSGCVVFPMAWGNTPGTPYPRHWDVVSQRSDLFRLTGLCPQAVTPSPSTSSNPSNSPSSTPSASPSVSSVPSSTPSATPSVTPSSSPSGSPTASNAPSASPSVSSVPSSTPSSPPSRSPSSSPSGTPSISSSPSTTPSLSPSGTPSASSQPSTTPSATPSSHPSASPSSGPTTSKSPSSSPSLSSSPSSLPSSSPSLSSSPSATATAASGANLVVQSQTGGTATPGPTGSSSTPSPTGSSSTPSPTGSSSTPGPTGSSSTPSPTGSTSTPGPTSTKSTPGPTASTGTPEPTGSASTPGPSSTKSTPGPTASTGTPGPTGSTSTPGPTSTKSTPGPTASETTPGPTGSTSTQGPTSTAATPGPTASTSTPGPTGSTSTPGPTGAAATPGPTTSTSTPGPTGTPATPGPTANTSTPGPTGYTSTPGPTGSSATPGPTTSVSTPSPTGTVATPGPTASTPAPTGPFEELGGTTESEATPGPTASTAKPSASPSGRPSSHPSQIPSSLPSFGPSGQPSQSPSKLPSVSPSNIPSGLPSAIPSQFPSVSPSNIPSGLPSALPSQFPSVDPSGHPSNCPSLAPSSAPSKDKTQGTLETVENENESPLEKCQGHCSENGLHCADGLTCYTQDEAGERLSKICSGGPPKEGTNYCLPDGLLGDLGLRASSHESEEKPASQEGFWEGIWNRKRMLLRVREKANTIQLENENKI